jgi:hypothetical protein
VREIQRSSHQTIAKAPGEQGEVAAGMPPFRYAGGGFTDCLLENGLGVRAILPLAPDVYYLA